MGLQFWVPKWWNWQTRRTQNPVGPKPRAGSTPAFGTTFMYKANEISSGLLF
jgi:hypothetical protein